MKGSGSNLTVLSRRLPLGPEENHEDKIAVFPHKFHGLVLSQSQVELTSSCNSHHSTFFRWFIPATTLPHDDNLSS